MNIWNKVFLGIIIVTSIAVVTLGAVEFHIRSTGQKKVADLEKRIEKTNEDIAKIVDGADPLKSSVGKTSSEWEFDENKGKIIERFDQRGRAWFGCLVREAKPKTLSPTLPQVETQVVVTSPFVPNEASPETDVIIPEILKGVVYVFEIFENRDESGAITSDKPGKFLGRFTVETVPTPTKFLDKEVEKNGFAVTLITADPLSTEEIDYILATTQQNYRAEHPEARWAIYLTPPVHQIAGIFDQLTDEEKLQIMASQPVSELADEEKQRLLEEFKQTFSSPQRSELTEAEKAAAENDAQVIDQWEQYRQSMDDPEAEQARGFVTALNWLYPRRSRLNRDIAIMETNIETTVTAMGKQKIENEKLEADCVLEEKRCVAMKSQGEHVKGLNEQYTAEENRIAIQIEKLHALQLIYASKIAEYQLKVIEKIEQKSGTETEEGKELPLAVNDTAEPLR